MKKLLVIVLTLVMCISLCACGGGTEVAMKETASTDIIDFKLNSAEFSYYASATSNSYAEPRSSSDGGIFTTNKGNTFVCMEYQITNNDRSSINVASTFDKIWKFDWKVNYNGKNYKLKGFDLNDNEGTYLSLRYARINGSKSESDNYILAAGETITVKTVGLVNMEPDSLSDSFDITVNVPNSEGNFEKFTFTM